MRRFAWIVAGAGLAGMGHGQTLGLEALTRAAELVRQREKPVGVPEKIDVETGQLGPGSPDPVKQELSIVRAPKNRRFGDRFEASGGVHLIYRGYDLFADSARGDLGTEIVILEGNVRAIGEESVIVGDLVEIRFKDRTFSALRGATTATPSLLGGRTLRDLFFSGESIGGGETRLDGTRTKLTSCELPLPHYELRAKSGTLIPNDRILLRNVEFRLFDTRLFVVPFLDIPLDQRSSFTPEVGQSRDEGFFIKTRWSVPVREGDRLTYLIDYFSKLGVGLGAEVGYQRRDMEGFARVYGISNTPSTFQFSNDHRQRWGTSTFQIANTYEKNNYLTAPGSTQERTTASLQVPQRQGSTRLTYSRNTNTSTGFSFSQSSYGFNDQRRFGSKTQTSVDVLWSESSSGSLGGEPIRRDQVDLKVRGQHELDKATAEIEYVRAIPVGENLNFFSSSDRTPVFALRSEARRLLSRSAADAFPFRAEVSVGEFADGRTRDRVTRSAFDFRVDKSDRGTSRARLDYGARFRQGIYSDGTALWTLNLTPRFSYRFGKDSTFNARYTYLRSQGYTPLQVDQTGRTDLFSLDLTARPSRAWSFAVQTGYDLRQAERSVVPWQTVGIRTEWTPAEWFMLRSLASYDPLRTAWTNVTLDASWQAGATFVTASARYDPIRHVWGNANLYVDALKTGRVKTTAVLAYNGFLKKVESAQLQFTLDLHCWEAILQVRDNQVGFRSGTEYALFFRLKALPYDSGFGIGQRGQAIGGTGIGF